MKKKLFTVLATATLIFGYFSFAKANGLDVKVTIDNKLVSFMNGKPFVNNNRTMVPLRDISQQMGYTVSWVPNTNSVELTKGSNKVDVKIGSATITINGTAKQMDVPILAVQGVTYVPVKFVGDAFGYNVTYDANTQTVQLVSNSTQLPNPPSLNLKLTIDNQNVNFTDSRPFVSNNRTMIPLRVITEQLGYTVSWLSSTNSVEISKGNDKIDVKIGSSAITVNGVTEQMDVPTIAVNNATYVPVKFIGDALGYSVTYDGGTQTVQLNNKKIYNLELSKWNIYNDGTHPAETTAGFNNALKWANSNGYTTFNVPAGTYLISKGSSGTDPNSQINMVSNMTFQLDPNAVIEKETNGYYGYQTLSIGKDIHDVTIKGGTYLGDKTSHDYYEGAAKWQSNHQYAVGDKVIPTSVVQDSSVYYYQVKSVTTGLTGETEPNWSNVTTDPSDSTIHYVTDNGVTWQRVMRNTHENGVGIVISGSLNVTIDGVKTENFTGDGIDVGVGGNCIAGLYGNVFVQGAIDDNGNLINSTTQMRLKNKLDFSNPIYQDTHEFNFWAPQGMPADFNVYFYKADGTLLSSLKNQGYNSNYINIPDGASYGYVVLNGQISANAFMTLWSNQLARNIVIENSESAYNRRQGISMSGTNGITITNNSFHDIKGTAPQYGIDNESGGFSPSYGIDINNNHFYNNKGGGIVFADGNTAVVENNTFDAGIGFFAWAAFKDTTLNNNIFNNSSAGFNGKATVTNNTFNNGELDITGHNVTVDHINMTDSLLNAVTDMPFGSTVSNVTINNTGKRGISLIVGGQAQTFNNVTIQGKTTLYTIEGSGSSDTVYNNLKVTDYNNYNGTGLPAGQYNNCHFETTTPDTNGLSMSQSGKYVFNNCTFIGQNKLFSVGNQDADVTISNSSFQLQKDNGYLAAITVFSAKNFLFQNNQVTAINLTSNNQTLIRFGNNVNPANTVISGATFLGNTFTTNKPINAVDTTAVNQGAPPYTFKNNILYNALLHLKTNDTNENNQLITK